MTLLQTSLNTVNRKKERLFPLNKRSPPFTSVQALLPEGMERQTDSAPGRDDSCITQPIGSTTDASGLCIIVFV